jgi:hypothetical protein
MENLPLEYQSKEFIKQTHKGGDIIQKMLNINDDENSKFSIDEYRNAMHNERNKRQQCIYVNNEEAKRRRELRLMNATIDPTLIDKKNTLKEEMQTRLAQPSKYIREMQDKLKDRVMAERMKQSIGTAIRKRNKEVFEMRESIKNNGIAPNANLDKWNVNHINIENDDGTNRIKRIIITKRRGRMADEIVSVTL